MTVISFVEICVKRKLLCTVPTVVETIMLALEQAKNDRTFPYTG